MAMDEMNGRGMMNRERMGPGMMAAEPPSDEGNESPSVFLSRQNLGGKEYQKGDTITLTVTDVDPETGDLQAELAGGAPTTSRGYEADFEEAMPEETEE